MRRILDEEKKRRGTYRRTADKRSWAGRTQHARKFHDDGRLTDAQKNLLTVLPADLVTEAKDCYEQCVRAAPWLQPIDRNGIIVYAHAVATESMAGRELDRCIKDPQFVDPKSEASEAAKLYLQIVTRQAALIAQWSDLLGFNPRARAHRLLGPPPRRRAKQANLKRVQRGPGLVIGPRDRFLTCSGLSNFSLIAATSSG